MGKPASMDLRERVVAAVEVEGLSRNQAAARYDVAVSSDDLRQCENAALRNPLISAAITPYYPARRTGRRHT